MRLLRQNYGNSFMHRRIGHEEKISTIFGIVYWGAINGKTKSKEPRKLNDFATQIKLSNCCHIHWLFQRNSFCWFAPSDFHNEWFHGIRRPKRSFDVVKITFAVFRNNYLLLLWCNIWLLLVFTVWVSFKEGFSVICWRDAGTQVFKIYGTELSTFFKMLFM